MEFGCAFLVDTKVRLCRSEGGCWYDLQTGFVFSELLELYCIV